jgi:hypothetical protein
MWRFCWLPGLASEAAVVPVQRHYQCYDDFCHGRQWLSPAAHIATAKQHCKTGGLVANGWTSKCLRYISARSSPTHSQRRNFCSYWQLCTHGKDFLN